MGATIQIAILANAAKARAELNSTASTAQKIGDKFRALRGPALLALGALGAGAKAAIDSASDLNEEVSKSEQIFGKQAGAIQKFAGSAEKSLGQSKRAALEAASNFGIIGQKAGLSGRETAAFSKKFTTLASDLASFNNTTPEEAVLAIGAAMRGESEPIRKYGVLLDDATLRARALKMGLIQTTSQALTPQQKALAASEEIMRQTTKAQGDFARTSDGAANKQRILAAQTENLKAKLGQQLLPIYVKFQEILSKVLDWMSRNQTTVKVLVGVLAGLAVAVLAVNAAMSAATAVMAIYKGAQVAIKVATIAWKNAQFALNIALTLNPIGVVIAAIVALVAIIVLAYKKSDTFRKIVDKAWNGIKRVTQKVWPIIKSIIVGVFRVLSTIVRTQVRVVMTVIRVGWNLIKTLTKVAWTAIKNTVLVPVRAIIALIKGDTGKAKQIMRDAWNYIKSATRTIWNGIKDAVRSAISSLISFVRDLPSRIRSVFSGAGSWLLNAGKEIIRGLIDGINSMIDAVRGKLNQLTDMIPDWKGPRDKDRKLLRGAGELIMGGLVDGFDRGMGKVRRKLTGVSREIKGFSSDMNADLTLTARNPITAPPSSSAGNATYQITIQAPVGSSSAEIGRTLIKHIEEYERAGGRRRA